MIELLKSGRITSTPLADAATKYGLFDTFIGMAYKSKAHQIVLTARYRVRLHLHNWENSKAERAAAVRARHKPVHFRLDGCHPFCYFYRVYIHLGLS